MAAIVLLVPATPPYRAAVLDDPSLPIQGCATPARTFERDLAAEGIPVDALNADELADPSRFNADRYDLLIVPTGATFPLPAKDTLIAFLRRGGDLLCTGGYAFDNLVVREGGRWVPHTRFAEEQEAAARSTLIPNGDFRLRAQGWTADVPSQCGINATDPVAHAEVTAPDAQRGARWGTQLSVKPGATYLIGADASPLSIVGPGFGFMAVYQYDTANKLITFRDFAKVRATSGWSRHEHRVAIAPNAARVMFYGGMYLATGTMRFTRVTCAPVPAEERINAHYGEPMDGLIIDDGQLTLCSPDQPLAGETLVPASAWGLPTGWRSAITVAGYEATAQLREQATWMPLVEARDRFGRFSGCAGAIVHHYAGHYPGSDWALFGATNRDLFAGSEGEALLRSTVRLLRVQVAVEQISTDLPIYRPGETTAIKLALANGSRELRRVTVVIAIAPPSGKRIAIRRRTVTLQAGEKSEVAFAWTVPSGAPDFVKVTAALTADGVTLPPAETGFCVYSTRAMQSGPRLRFRDNAYELLYRDGRVKRTTLFGTDTWAAMFSSRAQNPWTWYRDLTMMRDNGLHMYENLGILTPDLRYSELDWRRFDALIQLSQQRGLPYMAGLLVGANVAVDDATLRKQVELCRQFAARYKQVPGIMYYLNGDYRLDLSESPDLQRLWNAYLAGRYPTPTALHATWGADAVPGRMPLREVTAASWFDPRLRDLAEFKTRLVQRWVTALSRAIRSEDREHPITGEYYQHPYAGIDMRLQLDGIDSANFGYFDSPKLDLARLPATIKWNDMRRAGKSINIGEFGVKTHDAWAASREAPDYHVARTEREYRELCWWMVHTALAYGVTKIQNWCWADDPDNIFPWGVAWRNPLHPKPALKVWRNVGVFSDRVTPTYRTADTVLVMPDAWRLGAPEPSAYNALTNAIECLLATGVPFDVVNESAIPNPPAPFPTGEGGGRLRRAPQPPITGESGFQYAVRGAHHQGTKTQRVTAPVAPHTVIAPLAYGYTDAEIEVLRRLAEQGARVYVSGDVAVGPEGGRRPGRLARLCGVRGAGAPGTFVGLPEPIVTAAAATAVPNPIGAPLFRFRVGRGEVLYSPRPWEALPGAQIFGGTPQVAASRTSNLYLSVLPSATTLAARRGVWRVSVPPSGPNRLVSVLPNGDTPAGTPVTVREGGRTWRMEPGAGLPAMVLADPAGQPLAATGGRALRLNGRAVAAGTQPWMIVALDGRPIATSRALAVCLMENGTLRWPSHASGLRAWIVEWRDGRAVRIAPAGVSPTREGWQVQAPANELLLICPPGETVRWLAALKR